jgi:hypothetical protein
MTDILPIPTLDATSPRYGSGIWQTPTFNAADFTGSAGSWTVDALAVKTQDFTVVGNGMTYSFYLSGTSVASPGTQLRIAVPASVRIANRVIIPASFVYDNGSLIDGLIDSIGAASPFIAITRRAGGNWAASSFNTSISGQITFRVQLP